MPRVRPELRPLMGEFANQAGLPANAASDLEATIASSPYLSNIIMDAVESGALKRFRVTTDPHQSGRYSAESDTIYLQADNFFKHRHNDELSRLDNLAVVVGHESGHALLAEAEELERRRLQTLATQTIREASRDSVGADLTDYAERYLDFMRRNEAMAELLGMNALASRVTQGNNGVFIEIDFLRRAAPGSPCVNQDNDRFQLASGLKPSPDGTIQIGPGKFHGSPSLHAMERCYTDTTETIGQHGKSGYQAYNGAYVIRALAAMQSDYARGTSMHVPEIELDMRRLKLDSRLIEEAGVNLGGKGRSFDYVDISNGQRRHDSISHTRDAPNAPTPRTEMAATSQASSVLASHPSHPDYKAFETIHSAVAADGRWNVEQSANIAAALLREHKADPLSHRLDRVVIGNTSAQGETNAFAVYAPHGDKDPFFATRVEMNAAAQIPAARSLEQVEQLNRQAQELNRVQQVDTQAQSQNVNRMTM